MSNDYIANEIQKIMEDKSLSYPRNLAMSAAWVLGHFKGTNLKIYDLESKSALADYFVVASANNSTQRNSMADAISRQLKKYSPSALNSEGKESLDWTLIDAGDIVVHIFDENAREFYKLDEVWSYAKQIDIPASFYQTSDIEHNVAISDDDKNYF